MANESCSKHLPTGILAETLGMHCVSCIPAVGWEQTTDGNHALRVFPAAAALARGLAELAGLETVGETIYAVVQWLIANRVKSEPDGPVMINMCWVSDHQDPDHPRESVVFGPGALEQVASLWDSSLPDVLDGLSQDLVQLLKDVPVPNTACGTA